MFDPYREWLGIPDGPRPPTPAQLLGVAAGERDARILEGAAAARAARVRAFQLTRPHECTRLLSEIAQAFTEFLQPARGPEPVPSRPGRVPTRATAAACLKVVVGPGAARGKRQAPSVWHLTIRPVPLTKQERADLLSKLRTGPRGAVRVVLDDGGNPTELVVSARAWWKIFRLLQRQAGRSPPAVA